MVVKKIDVRPLDISKKTLECEIHEEGLKYAVVWQETKVIAVFNKEFWAREFIADCFTIGGKVEVMEVV